MYYYKYFFFAQLVILLGYFPSVQQYFYLAHYNIQYL